MNLSSTSSEIYDPEVNKLLSERHGESVSLSKISQLDYPYMDHSIVGPIIGALGAVIAAAIGVFKWKTQSKLEESSNSIKIGSIDTGAASKSNIAIGNNISQTFQSTHNHFNDPHSAVIRGTRIVSKPDPAEIAKAINAAKPYEKHQIKENYVGLQASGLWFFLRSILMKASGVCIFDMWWMRRITTT